MNNDEMRDILSKITYKPGWAVEFHPKIGDSVVKLPYLQVSVDTTAEASTDTVTRQRSAWKGGKVYLSPHMCRQEIVGAAFGAIQAAELHEMKEWFRYRGVSIYNPHIDPDWLVGQITSFKRGGLSHLSVRKDAMTMGEAVL